MPTAKPVGLLLAAGYARRFGGDKLLAPLPDGTPLAVASVRRLREGLRHAFGEGAAVLAVVRPEQDALATLLEAESVRVLRADAARRGMGASLAAAVTATADAAGWVVALADMPFIAAATVEAVACALKDGDRIVAPTVAGQRGHPVGFPAALGNALRALDGDEGARQLIARHGVRLIACEDNGALRDVDVAGDLTAG